MKRVLVTGAGGYVGRALTRVLEGSYRLRLLSRSANPGAKDPINQWGQSPGQSPGADWVQGDVRSLADLTRAARGVDAVVHLAAVTTDRPQTTDAEFFETNAVGTFHVLEAAAANGVAKVVYASSVCAVGFRAGSQVVREADACEPTDGMYGVSKQLGERLCEHYAAHRGLRVLCLRLAMVVPQHELVRPRDPSAAGWLGAVHIDDVVEAFRLALDNEPTRFGVFHIASGGPASKFDIREAKRVLGYRPAHRLEESSPAGSARPGSGPPLVRRLLGRARKALRLP